MTLPRGPCILDSRAARNWFGRSELLDCLITSSAMLANARKSDPQLWSIKPPRCWRRLVCEGRWQLPGTCATPHSRRTRAANTLPNRRCRRRPRSQSWWAIAIVHTLPAASPDIKVGDFPCGRRLSPPAKHPFPPIRTSLALVALAARRHEVGNFGNETGRPLLVDDRPQVIPFRFLVAAGRASHVRWNHAEDG